MYCKIQKKKGGGKAAPPVPPLNPRMFGRISLLINKLERLYLDDTYLTRWAGTRRDTDPPCTCNSLRPVVIRSQLPGDDRLLRVTHDVFCLGHPPSPLWGCTNRQTFVLIPNTRLRDWALQLNTRLETLCKRSDLRFRNEKDVVIFTF